MKVQVERNSYATSWFWLYISDDLRTMVYGPEWTRGVASCALDEVVRLTGVKRKSIRFERI
jgi:hypothetical protein